MKKNSSLNLQLFRLSLLELWRNKQGIAFMILVPAIFITMAIITSNNLKLPIKIYNFQHVIRLVLAQKEILLLYIITAVIGFLCSYYALVMFQGSLNYYKYCTFMGMSLMKYLMFRMIFFLCVVLTISILMSMAAGRFIPIHQFVLLTLGYLFMGFIYGFYGAIIGVISRNFLHSLLMIIMLTNLDVGWLQNPVYYSYAANTYLVRFLPAFFPCQFIFTSAFTDQINYGCGLASVIYIFLLFIVLFILLSLKFKGFHKIRPNLLKGL